MKFSTFFSRLVSKGYCHYEFKPEEAPVIVEKPVKVVEHPDNATTFMVLPGYKEAHAAEKICIFDNITLKPCGDQVEVFSKDIKLGILPPKSGASRVLLINLSLKDGIPVKVLGQRRLLVGKGLRIELSIENPLI